MKLFDAHADTISVCYRKGTQSLRARTLEHWNLHGMEAYDTWAQMFALHTDSAGKSASEIAIALEGQYAKFQRLMQQHRDEMSFCRSGDEAEMAFAEGKGAAFLSVEGAELISCSLEGLRRARSMGICSVTLTWNRANLLSGSCVEEPTRGLSEEGRAFCAEAERLGILLDVSHQSEPGFWDVLAATTGPVMASHSNAKALCPHARNLTDAQIEALVARGGIMGLTLYTEFLGADATFDTIRRQIDHVLALGGEEILAVGGDWDGCDTLAEGFEAGISGYRALYDYLLRQGFGESQLEKLFYKNLMKVVTKVCSM